MRRWAASELDYSGNREPAKPLGKGRSEFFAHQNRSLDEGVTRQRSSLFLIDQAAQDRSLHFTEVCCPGPKVGILGLLLVGCVARKDLMPGGRRIQVLLLDPGLDLFEDGRVREDHSLSIENLQFVPT